MVPQALIFIVPTRCAHRYTQVYLVQRIWGINGLSRQCHIVAGNHKGLPLQ